MTNAPPTHDPADDDSLQGMMRTVLRKFLMSVDDMLPARVIEHDRDANRVTVQPIVAMLTSEGTRVARAQLAGVPVFQMGGGGHMLSFNIKPGDLGWIKASDRDVSLFLQSYAEQPPNTRRLHSFEDGLFFPHAMKDFTIQDEDAENVVLQTLNGQYRVAVWEDRVKVTAQESFFEVRPGQITVQALNINLNGNVTTGTGPGTPNVVMEAQNTLTLKAPNMVLDSANIVIGGIPWGTHKHTNVTPGGGTSGNPTS